MVKSTFAVLLTFAALLPHVQGGGGCYGGGCPANGGYAETCSEQQDCITWQVNLMESDDCQLGGRCPVQVCLIVDVNLPSCKCAPKFDKVCDNSDANGCPQTDHTGSPLFLNDGVNTGDITMCQIGTPGEWLAWVLQDGNDWNSESQQMDWFKWNDNNPDCSAATYCQNRAYKCQGSSCDKKYARTWWFKIPNDEGGSCDICPAPPTSGPTTSPSSLPTFPPTPPPTSQPTPPPTSAPTPPPTSAPTTSTSSSPTTSPSPIPTTSPSSPPPPPPPPPPISGSNGDPHCKYCSSLVATRLVVNLNVTLVFDGIVKTWKQEHFEYHGQCDLVLAQDHEFADGLGLEVHIRTKLVRFWSYIKSVAIRLGEDVLEVEGSGDPKLGVTNYWINLEPVGKLTTLGGFPVALRASSLVKRRFEIDLSSKYAGQKIIVSAYKEFLKVDFVNGSEEAFGNTVGMLGNFTTGHTLARDGVTVMDDFVLFGNEWQVLPSENMLFHATSEPQFPRKCIEPEDPRGQRRRLDESMLPEEEAEKACAGIQDPLDRKDCVYDVLATQDIDMAGAY
eukprot:scaffold22714_cov155-Cylindrotheca_fusiformis.AAC.4